MQRFWTLALVGCLTTIILAACEPHEDVKQEVKKEVIPEQQNQGRQRKIHCMGYAPILSLISYGGFIENPLEPATTPYGGYSWFINGKCEVRHKNNEHVQIHAGGLTPAQLQEAKRLATLPVFLESHGRVFGRGSCEGSIQTITTHTGTIECVCGCTMQKDQMPPALAKAIDDIETLREQTSVGTQPLKLDVGILAIDERSPEWANYYAEIPDQRWQNIDFPLDLPTLASLQSKQVIRVQDPSVTARLRTLLADHQAWQSAPPLHPGLPHRLKPTQMYIKDASGKRFVVGVIELAEPGLVPGI